MVGAGTNRTKPLERGGPAIILVRPQLAVNIGTAARAMANFGLTDLRLVAPKGGWPPPPEYRETAQAAASGAVGLLEEARLFPTIAAAVGDVHVVWATTARERGQGKAVLLMAYEWRQAAERPTPVTPERTWPPATREQVLSFFEHLERELTVAGYFRPDDKRPVMRRNLRNIFHRIGLTEQDVRTLRGVVARLTEGPRRRPSPD